MRRFSTVLSAYWEQLRCEGRGQGMYIDPTGILIPLVICTARWRWIKSGCYVWGRRCTAPWSAAPLQQALLPCAGSTNEPICMAALPLAASCSPQASRLPQHVGCTASTAEKNKKENKKKKKRMEKKRSVFPTDFPSRMTYLWSKYPRPGFQGFL